MYLLGAGTPTPTPCRFGSAHVIAVAGDYLLFDCGPAATHKLVKAGLFPTKVDYLGEIIFTEELMSLHL